MLKASVRFFLFLVAAAMLGPVAAPAMSRTLGISANACVGGATSATDALALEPQQLDCATSRLDTKAKFVRLHADLAGNTLPAGERLLFQTDPASFDSMLLRVGYADGYSALIDIDPQMAVRNWFARTRFSVSLPDRPDPTSLDLVVERPQTDGFMRDARLIEETSATREHFVHTLAYSFICGLLAVPIVFGLVFFRVLRARFILWHMAMSASLLVFVLSNSGLVFVLWPDMPLALRFQFNTASLAIAVACAVMFVIGILEERSVPHLLSNLALWATGLMLAVKAIHLFDFEPLRLTGYRLFLASTVPVALVLAAMIGSALLRQSRAAIALTIAFAMAIVCGVARLIALAGGLDASLASDDALFVSLVVLAFGTSAAVGDRFMVIRVQRDRAMVRAKRMGRLALTDELTGLANRRAFDSIGKLNENQGLLVADIDRFKRINDAHGHATGDRVLAFVANILKSRLRDEAGTQIFRLGGEEFAIILRCADVGELRAVCHRLRVALAQPRQSDRTLPEVTLSIGGVLGPFETLTEAFERADSALYQAKDAGRDRCHISDSNEVLPLP